jgi:hypothetical protein
LLTRPFETGETARDADYDQRAGKQVSAKTGDGPETPETVVVLLITQRRPAL